MVLSRPLLMAVLFALWFLYNLNDNAEVAHNVPKFTFNKDETAIIKQKIENALTIAICWAMVGGLFMSTTMTGLYVLFTFQLSCSQLKILYILKWKNHHARTEDQ